MGKRIIINDCKHLGKHAEFYKNEDPKMHFGCGANVLSQQSDDCMFPDYICDPSCCVKYKKGGKEKVTVTKEQLKKYYKERPRF